MSKSTHFSIESKGSWIVATAALVALAMGFGAAWITAVALKDIAAEVGGARSVPALASSLVWIGAGVGGILMGMVAERIGVRLSVISGAVMLAIGLCISTLGPPLPLYLGHGVFMGALGLGAINAPLYVYVSRWFDRRRGSALALISSGSYLAGAMWPPVFEGAIGILGWRQTMLWYAALELVILVPLAIFFFRAAPEAVVVAPPADKKASARAQSLGWPPNLVFALMCSATLMCCIPMAMPQNHLVAFCSDLGMTRQQGALMLSVLLGCAFLSRQLWGVVSDRIGGLITILVGSMFQVASMTAFLLTQDEVGLFTVAAVFGLGFSGIIPAYALSVRELFPASEASWRIPTILMCTGTGMALGGWLAGVLYDQFGTYAVPFTVGIGANILNVLIIGILVWRQSVWRKRKR